MRGTLIIVFCLMITEAFGQDSIALIQNRRHREMQVLGGMYYDISSVAQVLTHGIGGRGGIVLDKKWIVGGYAQANLAINFDFTYLGLPTRIYTGQGGAWFGRMLFPDKAWNVALSSTISAGVFESAVRLSEPDEPLKTADAYGTEFLQCAPQIDVFVKVLPILRMSASIGYRFTLGMQNNPIVNNAQMNSLFTQVGFTIGRF